MLIPQDKNFQVSTFAWQIFWVGGENVSIGRMLTAGSLIWGVYSLLHLLLNGVVTDEVVLAAQVITGAVKYPAGHPHQIFYSKAFSLFNYLAAGLWKFFPNVVFISAVRNFLFVFLATFTPFALTLALTRKPMYGNLATIFTISLAAVPFSGVYPLVVFPFFGISHGHIGLYLALLTIALLLVNKWKTGGFLLGLLPSIHPTIAVLTWIWGGACWFFGRRKPQGKEQVYFFSAISTGLLCCAILAIVISQVNSTISVAEYPYDVHGNGEIIRQNFIAMTDSHRRLFQPLSFGYLANPVALFALGILLWWQKKRVGTSAVNSEKNSNVFWLFVLSVMSWIFIYGSWLFQYLTGSLPLYLEIMMPYRLASLSAFLLIPFTVAAIARVQKNISVEIRQAVLVLLAGLVITAAVIKLVELSSPGLFSHGFVANNLLAIGWGLLFALHFFWWRRELKYSYLVLLSTVAIAGTLLLFYQSSSTGLFFVISFLTVFLGLSLAGPVSRRILPGWEIQNSWLVASLLGCCLCFSLVTLLDNKGEELARISGDYRALETWLKKNAEPDELILPSIIPVSMIQAEVGHPVLLKSETLMQMSYIPRLAPAVGMMVHDIYGIDYSDGDQLKSISKNGHLPAYLPVWMESWKRRKQKEWQALGEKYKFRLVISPNDVQLDLPVALQRTFQSLYVIPGIELVK